MRRLTFLAIVNPALFRHIESSMAGYIHITALSARTGTDNRPAATYQVNYVIAGANYAIAYDEEELAEFLVAKIPLSAEEASVVMTRLHETGHANIGDVNIPEQEASSMGMEMIPEDF